MSLESQALKEIIIEDCKASLYVTAKILLGYADINPRTHGDMIETLESNSPRKLIVMPRGCFKSSIGVVAYSIWRLLKDPNLRIMIDSEKYANSKNFIREIRAKLENPILAQYFGSAIGPIWGEGEITVAWRNKPFKEASITASGIEAGKTGQHYDIIIHDDLNTDANSRTPEARQKVIDHYQMNTAILEPHGEIVVIGTRYSADDAIGYILENECKEPTSLSPTIDQILSHT